MTSSRSEIPDPFTIEQYRELMMFAIKVNDGITTDDLMLICDWARETRIMEMIRELVFEKRAGVNVRDGEIGFFALDADD